jgi:hypothetical protein
VWMSVESVGDAGSTSLGYYGGRFSPDTRSIVAHGFTGALHLWRREGELFLGMYCREERASCKDYICGVGGEGWDRGRGERVWEMADQPARDHRGGIAPDARSIVAHGPAPVGKPKVSSLTLEDELEGNM